MPVSKRLRAAGAVLSVAVASGLLGPSAAEAAPRAQTPTTAAQDVSGAERPVVTEIDALAKAKHTGKPVEVASQRGESSEVFATPDGKLEAREYLRPVWARVDGVWKAVDTDLAKSGKGMVSPKVATIGLEFSGGGDEAPMVRMVKAGRQLELFWPGELPPPRLDGDTATYVDVLPGVDLRLGAQEDGFTQLLVVKSAEAADSEELAELRLDMDARGLDVHETSRGGLEALDKGAGTAVFEAPEPVMWDSSPGPGTPPAGVRKNTGARTVAAQVTPTAETGDGDSEPGAGESGKLAPVGVDVPAAQDALVLKPDTDVLRGDDTVYPVFIDPQMHAPKATAWTMASKYWASSPQWKFNGESDAGMGYCAWWYCQPHDTKRLFYRIPVSKFAGKKILSAEFIVRNTWSASCDARGVQLWRTGDISSSTTWNSQNRSGFWIDHLTTSSFAHGFDGCAAKDAEFNVKSAVQQAADKKWSTMTFGLQASNEGDPYGWKRFSDDAFLRVYYNRPPPQLKMSQLTMRYGGTCKKSENAPRIRSLGTIYANDVKDPDGDDVAVQFQAKWDSGDGKGLITRWRPELSKYKPSGSDFPITLPSSVPTNKQIHWYARVKDKGLDDVDGNYSPWSYAGDATGCYFVYDTAAPKPPTITSTDYPAFDTGDPNDPWYDGIGRYGAFTVKAGEADVTRYWYGINIDPLSRNEITTTAGAARTINLLPPRVGTNTLFVKAFDSAGNASESSYRFRVKAGQPDRATWQLDEDANASKAEGSTPARILDLNGGATPGAGGTLGSALSLNGTTGYASTDLSVVETTTGFSISAWAKLDTKPSHGAMVATQIGNDAAGFELLYSSAYDRWVFGTLATDAPGATAKRAMAGTAGGAEAGSWTHLVGTYDPATTKMRLYVNGKLAGEVTHEITWNARRGLQIGAGRSSGSLKDFFPGAIDEVQLFDKAVAQDEVDKLYTKQLVGDPGRPAVAIFHLDEPDTETDQVEGHGGVVPATYSGGVTTGVPGVAGRAAKFNGVDGYGRIGEQRAPHVNTSRSFTVSAWAKMDRKPDEAAIITAQAGQYRSGFELYYSKTYDRWAFNQYSADAEDATPIRAMQPDGTAARVGEWVHLVGVHDTVMNTLTLYVNGAKAGSTTLTSPFYADQSMYIGAAGYHGQVVSHFPGTVDDLRLYDRPLSPEEVQQMVKQRPLVKGRWTFEQGSGAPQVTPDASASGNAMTLRGGATVGGAAWVDGGVVFDGVDDYGTTATAPVDTTGSFTISTWAQAAAVPQKSVTLLSAPGATTRSAFTLRYEPSEDPATDPGRWQVTTSATDTAGTAGSTVDHSQFSRADDWTHLALVYDGLTKELTLYVNGEPENVPCEDADGDGEQDVPTCADAFSSAENVQLFKSNQPLHLGASKTGATTVSGYWPGAVSDAWVFQGPLTEAQIRMLAVGQPGMATDVPGGF
ncbi:LamG-like jellyroll fold domain-containing protein [Streptomyces sp. NPDC008159]|uniref:LamG-like jellyroll fold domain-containing protein n=1 Tax=Streptomyces sp. NPDC008159 TaxID=3364817 RepID=UPI0036E11B30